MEKFRTLAPLAISILSVSAAAVAEDEASAACTPLLNHGMTNVVRYTSEHETLAMIKDEYCRESYASMSKSKQDAFSGSYAQYSGAYSGGKSSASEQHDYFCKNYNSLQYSTGKDTYDSKVLHDKAIDAWRDCIGLAIGGTRITPKVSNDERMVDFTMHTSSGSSVFTGVDARNMSCTIGANTVGAAETTKLTAEKISMRCERTGEVIKFQGANVNYFPPANVKVKTSTGDYRMEFYEMIDEPAKSRFGRLEAQMARLETDMAASTKTIDGMGKRHPGSMEVINNDYIAGADSRECAEGSYVSMIHASKGIGGKNARDGIGQLTFKCSPLRSP